MRENGKLLGRDRGGGRDSHTEAQRAQRGRWGGAEHADLGREQTEGKEAKEAAGVEFMGR